MRLSIIIPTLNEQRTIEAQLQHLSTLKGIDEILVVDGSSTDETVEIVSRQGATSLSGPRLLTAPAGRASQMNAGARAANGDVLLFLHSDVRLPAEAPQLVSTALSDPRVVAGAFRTWTVCECSHRLGPFLHLADLRSRYSNLPYGDQAIFVRRPAFERVGGYPDQPLMEDSELSRRLRREGRIKIVRASVRVSARRFLARPVYYTVLMNTFPLLYRMGVSSERLARLYKPER